MEKKERGIERINDRKKGMRQKNDRDLCVQQTERERQEKTQKRAKELSDLIVYFQSTSFDPNSEYWPSIHTHTYIYTHSMHVLPCL